MIGSFFMKHMPSGIIFSEIFGFVGHFLVSFCVSGTSFDVFGVLGGLRAEKVSKPRSRHHAPGRLWAPFWLPFLRQIVIISYCFLIVFLDAFFYLILVIWGAVVTCVFFCNFSETAVL